MKTIKPKFVRTTAVLLAVITVFSMVFALPVSAVSDEVTIIFDYCYDSLGNTIKFQQETTNDGYTIATRRSSQKLSSTLSCNKSSGFNTEVSEKNKDSI